MTCKNMSVSFKIQGDDMIIAVAIILKERFPDRNSYEDIKLYATNISEEDVLNKLERLYQRNGYNFIRDMVTERHSLEIEGYIDHGIRWHDNYEAGYSSSESQEKPTGEYWLLAYQSRKWRTSGNWSYVNCCHQGSLSDWLLDVQKYEDEIYVLMNSTPISEDEFFKLEGEIG